MIILFDALIIIPVLVALLIASVTDLKTREIPDWISYGLLFYIILTRALESIILRDFSIISLTLLIFLTFFAFGNLMYFTRQWGGGDTKLITALGTAFAYKPAYITANTFLPFPAILLLNILIVGAIYGILFAVYLTIKHKSAFLKEFKKLSFETKSRNLKISMLSMALLVFIASFTFLPTNMKQIGGMASVMFLIIPYILIVLKAIENSCLYKDVQVQKLTEGDWVQKNIYKNKNLIYKANPYGIDKKSIELLKHEKIKSVLVKEGIPFVPPFLIGTVITLIAGSAIFFPIL